MGFLSQRPGNSKSLDYSPLKSPLTPFFFFIFTHFLGLEHLVCLQNPFMSIVQPSSQQKERFWWGQFGSSKSKGCSPPKSVVDSKNKISAVSASGLPSFPTKLLQGSCTDSHSRNRAILSWWPEKLHTRGIYIVYIDRLFLIKIGFALFWDLDHPVLLRNHLIAVTHTSSLQ